MALFDLLLEELAKEIQEAPGWILLIISTNVLLMFKAVSDVVSRFVEIGSEKATFATLAAMVLFFLGDFVDTLVFPRERDGKRAEKLIHSAMIALAAWAFFLSLKGEWLKAFPFWGLWIMVFPLYKTLKKLGSGGTGKSERTGFECLDRVSGQARDAARTKLEVKNVYAVSKALAKAAKRYTGSWIWVQNESSKFVRSLVLPALGVAGVLAYQRYPLWALLALMVSYGLLKLYALLKARHMRALYCLALRELVLVVSDSGKGYSAHVLKDADDARIFCWDNSVVAFGKHYAPQVPARPSRASLGNSPPCP
jgi:hypothetical protein